MVADKSGRAHNGFLATCATRIARCHLTASFVPHVFFDTHLNACLDVSPVFPSPHKSKHRHVRKGSNLGEGIDLFQVGSELDGNGNEKDCGDSHTSAGGNDNGNRSLSDRNGQYSNQNSSKTSTSRDSDYDDIYVISLAHTERLLTYVESVYADGDGPPVSSLDVIDMYLDHSELILLSEGSFDYTQTWLQARDLFYHLFVDGTSVPIAGRADLPFLNSLGIVLNRLVRFLWACPPAFVNENLALLDIHVRVDVFDINRALWLYLYTVGILFHVGWVMHYKALIFLC